MVSPKVAISSGTVAEAPANHLAAVQQNTSETRGTLHSSTRIPALDGLRGIAILLVLIQHSISYIHFNGHPHLNWIIQMTRLSWSGVDLFFVLSGFLIGGILLDARDSSNYFRTFYIRRGYRILPLYGLIVTVGWLIYQTGQLGWTHSPWADLFSRGIPWWTLIVFAQNIAMALAGPHVGIGSLGPTWSLAVEEQFYLTLPLLVRNVAPRRLLGIVIPGIIAGAILLRAFWIVFWPGHVYATYVLMPMRADALGLGVLVALLARKDHSWSWLCEHRRWIYGSAILLAAALLLISLSSFEIFATSLYGAEYSLLALFYSALLLIAITGKDRLVRTVFCNKLLVKLGLIAYGTYLLHRLFIHISYLLLGSVVASRSPVFFFSAMFLGLAATIVVAQLSWTYFEKPLVRRGHRYTY
jgi:peptidoglycan/LPS O-acetylase OafA/YrhL